MIAYEGSLIEEVCAAPTPVGYYTSQQALSIDGSTALTTSLQNVVWEEARAGGTIQHGTMLQSGKLVQNNKTFKVNKSGKYEVSAELCFVLAALGGESKIEVTLVESGNVIAKTMANLAREESENDTYTCVRLHSVPFLEKGKEYSIAVSANNSGEGTLLEKNAGFTFSSGLYVTYFSD